jgi:hypothetical protein
MKWVTVQWSDWPEWTGFWLHKNSPPSDDRSGCIVEIIALPFRCIHRVSIEYSFLCFCITSHCLHSKTWGKEKRKLLTSNYIAIVNIANTTPSRPGRNNNGHSPTSARCLRHGSAIPVSHVFDKTSAHMHISVLIIPRWPLWRVLLNDPLVDH